MNRRNFLKKSVGAAVATGSIAMAGFDWFMEENPGFTFTETLNDWNDYTNFSSFALDAAIDPLAAQAAHRLAEHRARDINQLYEAVLSDRA